MTIPFTQYKRPDGRAVEIFIDRPTDIEEVAQRFRDGGGRYEAEVLEGGEVSLTAVHRIKGEEQDVAIVVATNGPGVKEKVDELVRLSEKHLLAHIKGANE